MGAWRVFFRLRLTARTRWPPSPWPCLSQCPSLCPSRRRRPPAKRPTISHGFCDSVVASRFLATHSRSWACSARESWSSLMPAATLEAIQRLQQVGVQPGISFLPCDRCLPCACNHMCVSCTAVSQARPHKSVNTQFLPHEGRSSVNPPRVLRCLSCPRQCHSSAGGVRTGRGDVGGLDRRTRGRQPGGRTATERLSCAQTRAFLLSQTHMPFLRAAAGACGRHGA